jgi:AraC-like DNA-binding protein
MSTETPESEAPVIKSNIFDGLADYLANQRLSANLADLLSEAGLDRRHARGGGREFIPLNPVSHVFERLAIQVQRPCLGLQFAEVYPIGAFGFLMTHAPSVRDAIDNLTRFVHGFTRPVHVEFKDADGGTGFVEWQFALEFTKAMPQFVTFTLGAVIMRLRQIAGAAWTPLKVELIHRPLPCPEIYQRLLGPNVRFDAPKNRLWLDPTTLALRRSNDQRHEADPFLGGRRPQPDYSTLYRKIMEDEARQISSLSAPPEAVRDMRTRLRAQIESVLRQGTPDLEATAGALGLEPRRLQYLLEGLGTSFSEELSEVRRMVAERLLVSTDRSMSEIADEIGFSELSSFTRASREVWFGMSPSKFRARMRAEDAARASHGKSAAPPSSSPKDKDGPAKA